MIVADTPEYKALRAKAQALDIEISKLTAKLDRQDAEFHSHGAATPQAERSILKAQRSEKQFEFRRLKIQMDNLREAFRIKGQTYLLDELIAVCRENGSGHFLGEATRRVRDCDVFGVEEGTPA